MKKKIRYYLFIFLINICIIFGLNYLIANTEGDNEYSMSSDYLKFKNNKRRKDIDLSFLLNDNKISVVAETNDSKVIGIYDPSMIYYLNSSKIISLSKYRYFSYDDYINKKNVSILIDSIHDVVNGKSSLNYESIEKKYNTNIINIFDFSSDIYEQGVLLVKNLFSINTNEISKIYIQNYENENKENIIKKFSSLDFIEEKDDYFTFFIKLIKKSLNTKLYTKAILFSVLIIYTILIFLTYSYINKFYDFVLISKIYGGNFYNIVLNFFKNNIIFIILTFILSSMVSCIYLNTIYSFRMKLDFMIIMNIINILIIFIIFLIKLLEKYFDKNWSKKW